MGRIFPGRFTATTDQPFVVFLVGMHINRPMAVHRWIPVLASMPPMLNELASDPEKGMVDSRVYLSFPAIMVVQYWRSFEHLERYARDPNALHLPAWRRFNQAIIRSKVVGVFHETYLIEQGQFEAVYVNMPRFGLANTVDYVPAEGKRYTARERVESNRVPTAEPIS